MYRFISYTFFSTFQESISFILVEDGVQVVVLLFQEYHLPKLDYIVK